MEKDFLPYELSLSLKELGFNEPCLDFYDDNKELFYNHENKEKIHIGNSVKAPLYQQAFRFFRVKYGLCGLIEIGAHEFSYLIFDLNADKRTFTASMNGTYEESELACLKKLIELVKSK